MKEVTANSALRFDNKKRKKRTLNGMESSSGIPNGGDGQRCVCGLLSTESKDEEDKSNLQIECDICRIWYHAPCLGLGPVGVLAIDKLHCPRCESMCGPSILRTVTNSHRHDRTDTNADRLPVQVGTRDFLDELRRRILPDADRDVVAVLDSGDQLTLPFLNQMGFDKPILVPRPEGLDIAVPDRHSFDFSRVPDEMAADDVTVDCIEVFSQESRQMKLSEFCAAFRVPVEERESPLNCLSLEVSASPLGERVRPPAVARKLCWVNNVWPSPQQWDGGTGPPQVQKYCIMSMEGSFTDFHIDFGGTSVWYHILKGEKIFYLIRPSSANLSLYERWQRLTTHSETFLGDMVDKCHKCVVKEGQTVFIPTGWIHAVYTVRDSLVFGGNFLHSLNIQLQLKIFELEERIKTPKKFRFPSFEVVHWLAAQKLKSDLSDLNSDSTLCPTHLLSGIKALVSTLKSWLPDITNRPCPMIVDPVRLVRDLNKEVRTAERIQMGCNPPKPERESKRKKQKKALNKDFIDISHKNAIAQLIKSPPKKRKNLSPVEEDVKRVKLKLPKQDFDLTDRDSVRKLLSNRGNSMKQLNSELSDALAGFSDVEDAEETKKQPIKLKLKMFGKEQQRPDSKAVHQDEDYIYPSLEMSDDEMEVGNQLTRSKDELWSPKGKVKTKVKTERPHRSKTKNKAVEMGLKMAAEKRKKVKSPPFNSKKLSGGSVLVPEHLSKQAQKPSTSSTPAVSVSSSKKKGATAKQRLGKILKLKF